MGKEDEQRSDMESAEETEDQEAEHIKRLEKKKKLKASFNAQYPYCILLLHMLRAYFDICTVLRECLFMSLKLFGNKFVLLDDVGETITTVRN